MGTLFRSQGGPTTGLHAMKHKQHKHKKQAALKALVNKKATIWGTLFRSQGGLTTGLHVMTQKLHKHKKQAALKALVKKGRRAGDTVQKPRRTDNWTPCDETKTAQTQQAGSSQGPCKEKGPRWGHCSEAKED